MDAQLEATNRSKGANFIDTVGHKLRLHHITIATATMFFHRFYMFHPLTQFHHYVFSLPSCGDTEIDLLRRSEHRVCSLRPKLKRTHGNYQT